MSIVIKNNASNFLAASIDSSQTTLTLQSAASFPTISGAQYFYVTLQDTVGQIEIVKVTARVGDTFTVVRGQEGTSAASFTVSSRVELRVTAQSIIDHLPYNVQNFTGTGSQTVFVMSDAPISENATNIYINGVYQQKNTYSVANNVLTFSEAPPVTSTIEVMYA